MAHVGVLVFRGQGLLSPSEQIAASALFGAGKLHSTHGEHAKAGSEHIFRLSSTSSEGIVGPGAEWHCDGSFLEDVFSHAGYHIVQLPNVPAGELELPPSAVCGARSSGASVGCSQGRRSRTSGTRMRC